MSERGHHSSGRGGGRGGGRGSSEHHRGGRGGGPHRGGGGAGGARGAQHSQGGGERPKKENILDLGKYMDKQITVKFNGGREGVCAAPLVLETLPLQPGGEGRARWGMARG